MIEIIESLITAINSEQMAKGIPEIFTLFEFDFDSYVASVNGAEKMKSMVKKCSENNDQIQKLVWQDKMYTMESVETLYDSVRKNDTQLLQVLLRSNVVQLDSKPVDRMFWDKQIEENSARNTIERPM